MYLKDKLFLGDAALIPYTREHMAEWLRQQNPDAQYCYMSTGNCLLAKYFTHIGKTFKHIGGITYTDKTGNSTDLPGWARAIARGTPSTFGDALKRAVDPNLDCSE